MQKSSAKWHYLTQYGCSGEGGNENSRCYINKEKLLHLRYVILLTKHMVLDLFKYNEYKSKYVLYFMLDYTKRN